MLYKADILIPPNTGPDNPVRKVLQLSPGTITKVSIQFPPGCVGLARLQILQNESQLWPNSPDTFFMGDTYPIEWPEDHEMSDIPYQLVLSGWNIDNLYEHSIEVRCAVSEQVSGIMRYVSRLFAPRA